MACIRGLITSNEAGTTSRLRDETENGKSLEKSTTPSDGMGCI